MPFLCKSRGCSGLASSPGTLSPSIEVQLLPVWPAARLLALPPGAPAALSAERAAGAEANPGLSPAGHWPVHLHVHTMEWGPPLWLLALHHMEEVSRQLLACCWARTGHHWDQTRPIKQSLRGGATPSPPSPITPETPTGGPGRPATATSEGEHFITSHP